MIVSRKQVGQAAAAAALSLAWVSGAGAQTLAPQLPQLPATPYKSTPDSAFTIVPARGGVYMLAGGGANVTVSVGYDGVLVVDPGSAATAPGLIAEIRKLSSLPVRLILDSNGDPDHVGANAAVAMAGQLLEGGNTRPTAAVNSTGGAPIWAHEGALDRLTAENADGTGLPSDSYFVAQKDMFVNGEPVQLLHVEAAHTNGDSMIMFRRADVISAGDIYTPDRYPVIDLAHGGSINGLINGLNYLLRLTVPEFNNEGGTLVIPGHGRLSDDGDVAEYRDMVTIIRDRVLDGVKKKLTLEQVKATGPTVEYDPRFGAAQGAVFVEQVYRSLTTAAQGAQRRKP